MIKNNASINLEKKKGLADVRSCVPAAVALVVAYGSWPVFAVMQKSSPVSAGVGRCQGCTPVTFTDAQGWSIIWESALVLRCVWRRACRLRAVRGIVQHSLPRADFLVKVDSIHNLLYHNCGWDGAQQKMKTVALGKDKLRMQVV